MHVVHIVPSIDADRGGPSRSVPGLCAAVATEDCSVELLTSDLGRSQVNAAALQDRGVRLRAMPCTSRLRRKAQWGRGMGRALREAARRADLIHSHGMWLPTNHAAAAAAHRLGLPHVITPRGMLTAYGLDRFPGRKRLARWLYAGRDLRRTACFHTTSMQETADLRRLLGLRQPVAIIPNGVDVPEELPAPGGARPAFLRTVPEGKRMLLFLSRIHPKKGLPMLAEVWGRLRARRDGWHLAIAGGDERGHRGEVEARLLEAGAESATTFIGELDDRQKWQAYAACDLFVLPTQDENFGIVVAEALAAGKPVVTTVGAPWAELKEFRCGWQTEIDAGEIEAALDEAMALTDAERAEMGHRGRQLVRERYGWRAIGDKMRAVYRWLVAGGEAPPCVSRS